MTVATRQLVFIGEFNACEYRANELGVPKQDRVFVRDFYHLTGRIADVHFVYGWHRLPDGYYMHEYAQHDPNLNVVETA